MKFSQINHPPILFGPTPFWHLRVAQLGVQIMPTTLILETPRPPPPPPTTLPPPPPPDFWTFLRLSVLCKLTTNLFQGSHETQHEAINKPLKSRFVIFFLFYCMYIFISVILIFRNQVRYMMLNGCNFWCTRIQFNSFIDFSTIYSIVILTSDLSCYWLKGYVLSCAK